MRVDRKIKFYQAGSSEMFGKVVETPQTEKTPFFKALMVLQKFMHIGLQKIIERRITFLHQMEFSLIMKVL